jgi:uncharacterized protein (TIGR03437 family)
VGKLLSTVSLSATPSTATFGQAITLTAQVGPAPPAGFAAPSGHVEFRDAGFAVGTATISSGAATLTLSNLPVGMHQITALYSEDATWAAGHSTAVTVTVSQGGTSTSLAPSIGAGGQVVLTATVTGAPATLGTPTGGVQFVDTTSHTTVATATLTGGTASASVSIDRVITSSGTQPIAAVYSGDSNFSASTSATLLRVANDAGYTWAAIAPDEIVNAFLTGIVNADSTASSLSLPTALGGISVKVKDSSAVGRLAPLYGVFAATGQINFVIPADTQPGPAIVTVTSSTAATFSTIVNITRTAAGIFSANASGQGVAAAQVVRVNGDGTQSLEQTAIWDPVANAWIPASISMGPSTDRLFLTLYGTGIRHRAADTSVTATVNGISVPVNYSGAQPAYPGVDQVNLELPRSLAGSGSVSVVVMVEDRAANAVSLTFQ